MIRFGLVMVIASITACGSVNTVSECGNGMVAAGEECDEGAANGSTTSCCTATCHFVASGATCRDSLGTCDQAETCTGASGACPPDITMPDGAACSGGNGATACSLADTCLAGVCANNDKAVGASCGTDACHLETCDATGVCPSFVAKTIMITNSTAGVSTENMDVQWKSVADALGHTATIVPVATLNTLAGLANADILIVSSGTQLLTQPQRDVVAAFVASGRGAYVQGEYLATYEGNITFAQIANANGGGFTWGTAISGTFPALASGCFGTTPNVAMTAFQQNFAVTGSATGPGVAPVQLDTATNVPVAFSYCKAGGGLVIVKTDQDDIRVPAGSVLDLMRNILYKLSYAKTCVQ